MIFLRLIKWWGPGWNSSLPTPSSEIFPLKRTFATVLTLYKWYVYTWSRTFKRLILSFSFFFLNNSKTHLRICFAVVILEFLGNLECPKWFLHLSSYFVLVLIVVDMTWYCIVWWWGLLTLEPNSPGSDPSSATY